MKILLLITRDAQNKVTSIYSPDLELELLPGINDSDNYRVELSGVMTQKLRSRPPIKPKSIDKLSQPIIPTLQAWETVEVDMTSARGFFTRNLPISGHIANMLAIITGCYSTYMALSIANSNHDDGNPKIATNVLATSLSAMINVIMYTYSGTSSVLERVGHDLDTIFDKNLINQDDNTNNIEDLKCTRRLFATFVVGVLMTNFLIAAISVYQETKILSERYLDLNPHLSPEQRARDLELINWLGNYLMIFTSIYSSLGFQWTFAEQFVNDVMQKVQQNTRNGKFLCFRYNSSKSVNALRANEATPLLGNGHRHTISDPNP